MYEHLEEGEVIVLKREDLMAVWNNSLTINFYGREVDGEWYPTDCCTMGDIWPGQDGHTWYDAREHALEYLSGSGIDV